MTSTSLYPLFPGGVMPYSSPTTTTTTSALPLTIPIPTYSTWVYTGPIVTTTPFPPLTWWPDPLLSEQWQLSQFLRKLLAIR